MDFLLAVGWIVASAVLGYLVTRSVKEHIGAHRETKNEIAELRLILEAHHRCIFMGQEGYDEDEESDELKPGEYEAMYPDPETEDDLPF